LEIIPLLFCRGGGGGERHFCGYYALLFILPRVSHEVPRVGRQDVLCHEETGVDTLKVLEGLGQVAVEGLQGLVRARHKELRDQAADCGTVEVVRAHGPFGSASKTEATASLGMENRVGLWFMPYHIQ
jgi:hypothetical protein